MDIQRVTAEAEAAMSLRPTPTTNLTPEQTERIMSAPMLPCGHLAGFEPAWHQDDTQACIANVRDRRLGIVGY